MDQRQIDVFVAVMRLGSVTAAAEALGMSQPSVSKAIALTERRLGFPLFDRVRGRLEPTPEASLVFEEALRLQENASRFERFLVNVRDFRAGQLRVAATPALAVALLPLVAKQFRARFPQYGLVLDMQLNHEIPHSVETEEYDIGLLVVPTTDENPRMQVIRRGEIVCVLPRGHALGAQPVVEWEALGDVPLIHITTDKRIIDLMTTHIPDFSRRMASSIESNRYTTAVNLVEQGLGVTLVDEFTLIGTRNVAIEARQLKPGMAVSLVAVTARRHSGMRAAAIFTEIVTQVTNHELGQVAVSAVSAV